MKDVRIRTADQADLEEIKKLLGISALPFDDLDHSAILFFAACTDQRLAGVIGLERYGDVGLLRSFAVIPDFRKRKIGEALYNHLMDYCSVENMNSVHLLTTTAESFFVKRGFKKAERSAAPQEIQSTAEFSHLCPSSSVYMVKILNNPFTPSHP